MDRESVEAVLRRCGLADEYAKQEAVFLWPEVVGQLAAFAEASFVRERVLHVVANNSSATQELNLLSTELLGKLNQRLRGEKLRGIRVSTGDVRHSRQAAHRIRRIALSDPEAALFAEVDDPVLRAAFMELYRRQRSRETALEERGARRCPQCGVAYSGRDPVCPGCRYDAIEESSQAN
ncbi:MAG: DUF721 domain-containing protein [Candidatus Bipolaricaulota bacterium]|nr:DUF721 domain-containing protein [Candidatus Bipolaricaulota bacterium]